MMKFFHLRGAHTPDVYLNVEEISVIEEDCDASKEVRGSDITMKSGKHYIVLEKPEDIIQAINNGSNIYYLYDYDDRK